MSFFKVKFISDNSEHCESLVFEVRYKEKTGITYILVADNKKLKWIDIRNVEVVS